MNKVKIKSSIIYFGILISFFSCKSKTEKLPDLEGIEINNNIIRYEQELLNYAPYNPEKFQALASKHPVFTSLFFNSVLPLNGKIGQDTFCNSLNGFLQDSLITNLFKIVEEDYSDFSALESDITQALKTYKYYFPYTKIPNIYTFISEYSFQKFIFQDQFTDGIGIGLDMFLGADYPYKYLDPDNPNFSQYITRRFTKEHIVLKIVQTLLEDNMLQNPGERLIDKMVQNGKKLYITKKILPTSPDSIIFEYTDTQMKWCNDNELQMWAFFFDQNLFYETSGVKINKFIDESPNSPNMPTEAPGRTGNYLGYKIVDSFMKKNKDMTLSELILFDDAQKLMEMSNYKPKKE
jgi:hypothetical protein